jgi:BetR domain
MEATNIQNRFFQQLKTLLPPHVAMVDEVADLLAISNDSAYRRIRGEKPISLEEMQRLAVHYKISLDQFMHIKSDSFLFAGTLGNISGDPFEEWLSSIGRHFSLLTTFPGKHLYYLTRDVTFVEHFQLPELAAFKFFFWKKSIFQYEEMKKQKFSFDTLDPKIYEAGRKIYEDYCSVPTTEIWNIESINTTIRQIEFYREAEIFDSAATVRLLYAKVEEMINHLEKQAEYGCKFPIGKGPKTNAAAYNMFVNELILGDNSFLIVTDTFKVAYISHSILDYMVTHDEAFCNYRFASIQNLIKKSASISIAGEKERTRFFNRLRDKIRHAAKFSD